MARSDDKYDIVIVGAGPVGLLLSLCLSRWGYKVKHIDNRPVPTVTGRADGIQPRSTEILRNLGLKRALMAYEPAKVFDVAFWDPLPGGKGIHRTGNWPSCPRFIDTRYPFTTLVHQGKIERIFLDEIEKAGTTVLRPWTIIGFKNDGKDESYPVEVKLKCLDTNVIETVHAKYLFSGEGARSFVREELGIQIQYKDQISFVWGVMDGVVLTDFPDIKVRSIITSYYSLLTRKFRLNAQFTRTVAQLWSYRVRKIWFDSMFKLLPQPIQIGIQGKLLQSRRYKRLRRRSSGLTASNGIASNGILSTRSGRELLKNTLWITGYSWGEMRVIPTA
jgi:2-polyprenyl-6-methoxyphenol hydroxylase-like FAD-dependent oxidoreductase